VLGCAEDAPKSGSQRDDSSGVAGGGSVDSGGAQVSPPGSGRGTVTLLGANLAISRGTWSFTGPAQDADDGESTVSCSLGTRRGHPRLDVFASVAGSDAPSADFSLELLEAKPLSEATVYDGSVDLMLEVNVAFTQTGGGPVYRYATGADSSTAIESSHSCSVTVSELSERRAVGQIACRNLLSTASSADVTLPDGSRGRASATVAFDCPLWARSAPEPGGTGGSSSTGGRGSVGGSSTGGSSTGGSTSVAGTTGTGGSASPPKSCHGVPTACSLRGSLSCELGQGCARKSECTGVSRSCYAYFEASGCYGQEGCYWSSLSKNCQGSSWSCDLFDGSSSCISQYGCDWSESCDGVATPCSLLSEFTCTSQLGCSWD